MGGRKITAKSIKRKDQATHPNSRRAKQLDRVALRDHKLASRKAERDRATGNKIDRLLSLVQLLPADVQCLPNLPAVHNFMNDAFLSRRDAELKEVLAERRPGRAPSQQEHQLKQVIDDEKREYTENMEIPDLLNAVNVRLLRQWKGDPQALYLYRMVRISGTNRQQYVRTQDGRHKDLAIADEEAAAQKPKQSEESANPSSDAMDATTTPAA
ncbi:unnamed protein product [Jaminaea pallidilutea]